jgi:hypothetical protein
VTPIDFTHPLVDAEVCEFIMWMIDRHMIGSAPTLVEFLEKPWKWSTEYDEYRRHQADERERERNG